MSNPLRAFLFLAGGLFLLRLLLGFLVFPPAVAAVLSMLSTVVFVGVPVYAMYRAASHEWEARHSLVFLAVGALLHIGGAVLARYVSGPANPAEVVFMAIVQTGILCWTLGIGTLLSLKIGDKNLMIPIAIFLVGFDMFLVFNPDSPTRRMLEGAPQVTQNVLATVPEAKSTESPKAGVRDFAQVGPADLLFAATFFTLLFRFRMRARQTLLWLVPILVAYLLVVVFFGHVRLGPLSLALLPAMVPIGLTVLIVNAREFKLQGQEIVGTVFVAVLAAALAWFGIYRASQAGRPQAQPSAPSTSVADPAQSGQEGSPAPAR